MLSLGKKINNFISFDLSAGIEGFFQTNSKECNRLLEKNIPCGINPHAGSPIPLWSECVCVCVYGPACACMHVCLSVCCTETL